MLAGNFDINRAYGIEQWLVAIKLDGIRCSIQSAICNKHNESERVFSRTGKRIPNHEIRKVLGTLPDGLDGELIVPDGNFQDVTTAVMTENLEGANWHYKVFDYFIEPDLQKSDRLANAEKALAQWAQQYPQYANKVSLLDYAIMDLQEALAYCKEQVKSGEEGIMVSDPMGVYLHRRCKPKEAHLLKMKHFADAEAKIVGYVLATYTGYTNIIKEVNEFAEYADLKPKQMKALMQNTEFADRVWAYVGQDKPEMGSLICYSSLFNETFSIGTGFAKELRIEIAKNPDKFLGKTITFKYMECGTKIKPRCPVFLRFREAE